MKNQEICCETREEARKIALRNGRGYLVTMVNMYHDTMPKSQDAITWPNAPLSLKDLSGGDDDALLDAIIDGGNMLCGTPDEVAEQIARWGGVGMDQLVFGTVVHDPHAPNIAREVGLATLPKTVPATTVSRACATANQAITDAANLIEVGAAGVVVAGGSESLSHIPIMVSEKLSDILVSASKAKTFGERLAQALGLRHGRGARSTGAMLCVALAFGYYTLLSLAEFLGGHTSFPPALALWLPNAVFLGVSIPLLRRARHQVL